MSYFKKIFKALNVIRHKASYINKATYYPEAELKNKSQILKDFLWFIWKYGIGSDKVSQPSNAFYNKISSKVNNKKH